MWFDEWPPIRLVHCCLALSCLLVASTSIHGLGGRLKFRSQRLRRLRGDPRAGGDRGDIASVVMKATSADSSPPVPRPSPRSPMSSTSSMPASPSSSSSLSSYAWGLGGESSSPVDPFLCGRADTCSPSQPIIPVPNLDAPETAEVSVVLDPVASTSQTAGVPTTMPPPVFRDVNISLGRRARELFPQGTCLASVQLQQEVEAAQSASSQGLERNGGEAGEGTNKDIVPVPFLQQPCRENHSSQHQCSGSRFGSDAPSTSFYVAADVDVDVEVWRFWQPFQGGRVFVATQVSVDIKQGDRSMSNTSIPHPHTLQPFRRLDGRCSLQHSSTLV